MFRFADLILLSFSNEEGRRYNANSSFIPAASSSYLFSPFLGNQFCLPNFRKALAVPCSSPPQQERSGEEAYFTTLNLIFCVLSDDVPTMIVKSPGSTIHFMSLS